eukprot:UN22259
MGFQKYFNGSNSDSQSCKKVLTICPVHLLAHNQGSVKRFLAQNGEDQSVIKIVAYSRSNNTAYRANNDFSN